MFTLFPIKSTIFATCSVKIMWTFTVRNLSDWNKCSSPCHVLFNMDVGWFIKTCPHSHFLDTPMQRMESACVGDLLSGRRCGVPFPSQHGLVDDALVGVDGATHLGAERVEGQGAPRSAEETVFVAQDTAQPEKKIKRSTFFYQVFCIILLQLYSYVVFHLFKKKKRVPSFTAFHW